jgi:CHASE3 domain sensor protein
MDVIDSGAEGKIEKMSVSRKIVLGLNLFTIVLSLASIAISLAAVQKSRAITPHSIPGVSSRG